MRRRNMWRHSGSVTQFTKTVVLCRNVVQSVKHNLLAAFRYLLRPLVRIAIRNGIAFPEFSQMLEDAYVHVAARQLVNSGREPTPDAISVMTEVGVAEVRDLLESPDDAKLGEAEQKINAASRLLVGWHTDRDYIGPYGLVRDLLFAEATTHGKKVGVGFAELAKRYCAGYPPRVLLDELVRTGCVQDLGNGYFRALNRSYFPEQLSAESIRRFAHVVHNVTETLEFNLRSSADAGRRVERTVFADYGLKKTDLEPFQNYLRERGQIFLDDIDNWLSTRSVEGIEDAVQTGVGFYHYIVNEEDEQAFGKALRIEGTK